MTKLFLFILIFCNIQASEISIRGTTDVATLKNLTNGQHSLFLGEGETKERVLSFSKNLKMSFGGNRSITIADALLIGDTLALVFNSKSDERLYGYISLKPMPKSVPEGKFFYPIKGSVEGVWYPDIMMSMYPRESSENNSPHGGVGINIIDLNNISLFDDSGYNEIHTLQENKVFQPGRILINGEATFAHIYNVNPFLSEEMIMNSFGVENNDIEKFKRMVSKMEGEYFRLLKIANKFENLENTQRIHEMIRDAFDVNINDATVVSKTEGINLYDYSYGGSKNKHDVTPSKEISNDIGLNGDHSASFTWIFWILGIIVISVVAFTLHDKN